MNRRRFVSTVAGGLVVASLDVVAQQMAKMFRIGVIAPTHVATTLDRVYLQEHLLNDVAIDLGISRYTLSRQISEFTQNVRLAFGAAAIPVGPSSLAGVGC